MQRLSMVIKCDAFFHTQRGRHDEHTSLPGQRQCEPWSAESSICASNAKLHLLLTGLFKESRCILCLFFFFFLNYSSGKLL